MIKFVYFDMGGVVIRDFSATNKWVELKNEFNISEEFWETHYEKKLDRGDISAESHIPYNELLDGFVSRFERNEHIWPVINNLQKNVMVGLLTNMYPGMFQAIKSRGLLPPVEWDVIIDSSVEKIAKPDPKVFKLAQDKTGVGPNEILFIENTLRNLDIPKKLGWETYFYDSADYEQSSENLLEYLRHATKK